jgi:uncharacterized protein YbjT (DUF2867 family)
MKTVLVTGATGKQGGAVARLLLEKGHSVRALVRDPRSPGALELHRLGAGLVEGSLENQRQLDAAAAGTDAVFAVTTPFEHGMEAEVQQGKALAEAAKSAGAHLVFTSVIFADRRTGIPHFETKWEIEQYIASLAIPHTILRPAYFMENLLSPMVMAALQHHHVIALPLSPDVPMMQVATADIAAMAVLAMENPDRIRGTREIAGDRLTGQESADILSRVTGRPIGYMAVPIDAIRSQSEDLAIMFEYFEHKRPQIDIGALHSEFPEVRWHTFEAWARKQDWSVLEQGAMALD